MAAKPELKAKQRLRDFDDLFQLNGDGQPEQTMATQPATRQQCEVPIDSLTPFKKHPFRLYTGERLNDMVESIRQHGVLIPIIARQNNGILEILSGHNRANASKLAGRANIPAIIHDNLSDADAWVYVIETNLLQRSFADMSHSEKAAVIALHHSKLFSQGKRNDIIAELKLLENPHDAGQNGTSVEKSQKLDSREALAKEYGLAPFRVAQYLRVFQLTPQLKERLDSNEFAVTAAVALSFLQESEQERLDHCLVLNRFKVDGKKASLLRAGSEKDELDDEKIRLILSGKTGANTKPGHTSTVKVSKTVYAQYFRPDQPAKEVQDIVEKALALYFNQSA